MLNGKRTARVMTAGMCGGKAVPFCVTAEVEPGKFGVRVIGGGGNLDSVHIGSAAAAAAFGCPNLPQDDTGWPEIAAVVEVSREGAAAWDNGAELAAAVAVLLAAGAVPPELGGKDVLYYGGLRAAGYVYDPGSAFPVSCYAADNGLKLVCPEGADVLDGIGARCVARAEELVEPETWGVAGRPHIAPAPDPSAFSAVRDRENDGDGLAPVKRALAVAAAARKSILVEGCSNAAVRLLAWTLRDILPSMDEGEARAAYTVWGSTDPDEDLYGLRPFCAPGHGLWVSGAVGGGWTECRGVAAESDNGVLYLEQPDGFKRSVIDALAAAHRDGLARRVGTGETVVEPARGLIIGHVPPMDGVCAATGRPAYLSRNSLLRSGLFDLCFIRKGSWTDDDGSDEDFAAEVARAWATAPDEHAARPVDDDAASGLAALKGLSVPVSEFEDLARSIADMEGAPSVTSAHVTEAVNYLSARAWADLEQA